MPKLSLWSQRVQPEPEPEPEPENVWYRRPTPSFDDDARDEPAVGEGARHISNAQVGLEERHSPRQGTSPQGQQARAEPPGPEERYQRLVARMAEFGEPEIADAQHVSHIERRPSPSSTTRVTSPTSVETDTSLRKTQPYHGDMETDPEPDWALDDLGDLVGTWSSDSSLLAGRAAAGHLPPRRVNRRLGTAFNAWRSYVAWCTGLGLGGEQQEHAEKAADGAPDVSMDDLHVLLEAMTASVQDLSARSLEAVAQPEPELQLKSGPGPEPEPGPTLRLVEASARSASWDEMHAHERQMHGKLLHNQISSRSSPPVEDADLASETSEDEAIESPRRSKSTEDLASKWPSPSLLSVSGRREDTTDGSRSGMTRHISARTPVPIPLPQPRGSDVGAAHAVEALADEIAERKALAWERHSRRLAALTAAKQDAQQLQESCRKLSQALSVAGVRGGQSQEDLLR